MTSVTVPTAPALSRIADVELMQTGTWDISNGTVTFTVDDIMAAVAAVDCPAVRRPVLKLGHTDPRFDGQPAVGYIDNLRSGDDWRTLIGDYAGMPGWLGDVIASAYPDRSIEGEYGFRCQMGHTHPFVITAVALLGVTQPGVGSLESLQDVGRLFGVDIPDDPAPVPPAVTASAVQASERHGGTRVRLHPTTDKPEASMPNPSPRQVAASVSSDDVTRAFYASPVGNDWDAWIEELELDPLQIIYVNDASGDRFRIPVTIGSGDGVDAVGFGDPVKVVVRYQDAAVAASAGKAPIRFASRAESRPGERPAATKTPAEPPVAPSTTPEEADTMSDTLSKGLRERLGVNNDADETTLLAALDEALGEQSEPEVTPATIAAKFHVPEAEVEARLKQPVAASAGESEVTLLRRELDAANTKIGELAAARAKDDDDKKANAKRDLFASAFDRGVIGGPDDQERRDFERDYDEAPRVIERILASRADGYRFPVKASGYSTDPTTAADPAAGDDYWFQGARKPAFTNAGD